MHLAVDTLGHLLALHVTAANEQDRAQVEALAQQVQEVTGGMVELAFVDQGYTGDQPAEDAAQAGMPGGRETARCQEGLRLAAAPLGGGV